MRLCPTWLQIRPVDKFIEVPVERVVERVNYIEKPVDRYSQPSLNPCHASFSWPFAIVFSSTSLERDPCASSSPGR